LREKIHFVKRLDERKRYEDGIETKRSQSRKKMGKRKKDCQVWPQKTKRFHRSKKKGKARRDEKGGQGKKEKWSGDKVDDQKKPHACKDSQTGRGLRKRGRGEGGRHQGQAEVKDYP